MASTNIEFLKESLKIKLAEAGLIRKQIADLQAKSKSARSTIKAKPTSKPARKSVKK